MSLQILPPDLAGLLPAEYAPWLPVMSDAFGFFLSRLSPQRQAEVCARLAPHSTDLERLMVLLHHCPTLHKLGQVVARDRRIDARLRARLQQLEMMPPSLSMDVIGPLTHNELRTVMTARQAARVRLDRVALAEASVAVVVGFTLDGGEVDGVFKLLKPGVEAKIDEELNIWSALGERLDARCAQWGLPPLDYADTFDRVKELIQNEVRLDQEQRHLAQAADAYNDPGSTVIPRLLAGSTPRMTAMTRIHGRKVTDVEDPSSAPRRAAQLIETLLMRPLLSADETVPLHADPHGGNLFWSDGGHLAVLDWSLVTYLPQRDRATLAALPLAALTLDRTGMEKQLISLAKNPPASTDALRRVVTASLREVRHGKCPDFAWLSTLLDRAALEAGLSLRENLVLLRKALMTLEHVAHDVCPHVTVSEVANRSLATRFLSELPRRAITPPWTQDFVSPISGADLYEFAMSWPIATARWWLGYWQDVYRSGAPPCRNPSI